MPRCVKIGADGVVLAALEMDAAFAETVGYVPVPDGLAVTAGWTLAAGAWTPPAQSSPDPATQKRLYAEAVQRHLDATVQARDYADIATCVTYADEPAVPHYQAEGQAARAWRSLVWAAVYEAWRSVEAGERDAPSVEALIAELPVIVWPSINALHSHL